MTDLVIYCIARLLGFIVRFLPHRLAVLGSRIFADLLFHLFPKRRRLAERNLRHALDLGPKAATELAREVFREKAMTLFEFLSLPRVTAGNIDRFVEFEGLDRLDRALESAPTGPILVTAHFGNWELLAAALARKGYPVNAVVKTQHNSYADRMINHYRRAQGINVIVKGFSLREAYRRLKAGEALIILADQASKKYGISVEFFGRKAHTPVGPARFSEELGSPVIPVFMIRYGYFRHRLVIARELRATEADDGDYVRELTRAINRCLEEFIREYPAQWNWLYRRWRSTAGKTGGEKGDPVAENG